MGVGHEIPPIVKTHENNARRMGRVRLRMTTCNLGEVLNVSATGARVMCKGFRGPKAGDRVWLRIDGLSGPIDLEARVVWNRRNGLLRHDVGIEFQDPSPAAKKALGALARTAPMNDVFARLEVFKQSA